MAQIQKGTTYITGDQVTAANLNALADSAILLPGAVTDQTAKAVPLAADTVLIHSAADTALRKSTLTQLFSNATGIPISTGISGLGTGVATALAVNVGSAGAPVVNGGALGTPASGTVTNLTGTASININGTVGATTPSTVAGTTGTFSGNVGLTNGKLTIASAGNVNGIELTGSSTNLTSISFVNSNASAIQWNWGVQGGTYATAGIMSLNLSGVGDAITVNGSTRSVSLPAGLNSTAIGATTPSTVAATTISATSSILSTGGGGGATSSGQAKFGGDTTYGAMIGGFGSASDVTILQRTGSAVALFSSTGLAVTGTGTTSGNFGAGAAADGTFALLASSTTQRSQLTLKGSNVVGIRFQSTDINGSERNWGFANNIDAQGSLSVRYGASQGADPTTTMAQFSSTGLAVTGAITATGVADLSGGVSVGNGISTGLFGDSSNLAIRGYSTGLIYFQSAGGAANYGTWGSSGLFVAGLGTGLVYSSSGTLTSTNPSDARLKTDITDIGYGLSSILALRPVSYKWKSDTVNQGTQYGFIAQEVQTVMPDLVKEFETTEDGETVIRLGLEKEGIYAALVKSVQELNANLVAELQSVRARLAALESK